MIVSSDGRTYLTTVDNSCSVTTVVLGLQQLCSEGRINIETYFI